MVIHNQDAYDNDFMDASVCEIPPIAKGKIICLRLFDVSAEINLQQAESMLLAAQMDRASIVFREPPRRKSGGLAIAATPLHVDIGTRRLSKSLVGHLSIDVYDYGTLAVRFELAMKKGATISELLPIMSEVYESAQLTEMARKECDALIENIEKSVQGRHKWKGVETYTIVFIEKFEKEYPLQGLLVSSDVASLLSSETSDETLSKKQIHETLDHFESYFDSDLVVMDWNAALAVEPSGSLDVVDVLQFAISQLLQLRYYDEHLDTELKNIYQAFNKPKSVLSSLLTSPYRKLAHDVSRQLVETTEFTERIEKSFKIFGDFYLARVFRTSLDRFGIQTARESIARKHQLVSQMYTMLNDESEHFKSFMLEVTVVLLIVVEVIMGFMGNH